MNRIPTEGLKHNAQTILVLALWRLNEQNPDRGIETIMPPADLPRHHRLNEQNPDRGIETLFGARAVWELLELE